MKFPRGLAKKTLIFLGSYFLFLISWFQVKDYYGMATVALASNIVTGIKDVKYEYKIRKGDVIEVIFKPLRHRENILIGIPVKTSFYTFNVPLTLSIMVILYPILRKKLRAYGEALMLLFSAHLLYVFSLEANELTNAFIMRGYEFENMRSLIFYQFLWGFTDNMVIRFEPYLIGIYLFLRYSKERVANKA